MEVTKVYSAIKLNPKRFLKPIIDKLTQWQIDATQSDKTAQAAAAKTTVVSIYGKFIENKENRSVVSFGNCVKAKKMLCNPLIIDVHELYSGAFEIHMLKNEIRMDCAEIIGYFILQNAKKHMLEFVYDMLGVFIDPRMIELLVTDTDSIGMSLACNSLDEAVLPEKKTEWVKTVREHWFPMNMELKEKIPGKFLIEASGTEFVGLCAKTYIIWDEDDEKKEASM
ncbi:MAG: hypothetical protein GY858_05145 [Candidatus Omnitrophica bacterium]|nr:hypothetical protein [Candidatus Omnitrophota bacterium]